jgi:hypothetical protein
MSDRVWFKLADGTEIYVNVPLLVPELEADEPADADQLHNVNSFFQTICDLPYGKDSWGIAELVTKGVERYIPRKPRSIDRLTSEAVKTKQHDDLAKDIQVLASIRSALLAATPEVRHAFKDALRTADEIVEKRMPNGTSRTVARIPASNG